MIERGMDDPPQIVLAPEAPYVWPEPQWLAGQARYESIPPVEPVLAKADLLAGVLVGVEDKTIHWLRGLVERGLAKERREIRLVVTVYPAGPTREADLLALKMIQDTLENERGKLEIRILPTTRAIGADFEKMVLLPTVLLGHDSKAGKTFCCFGSVGDSGHDWPGFASFNAVFEPDAAFCNQWRRWFQYLFCSAVPLTAETVRIPALVPARGDPSADLLWAQFELACWGAEAEPTKRPTVDPQTGEVIADADGGRVEPWDAGRMQLDPLAQKLQKVYAEGWLATVDETTRIKPLAIPVKATLLGEQAERAVGAVTQKQSFNLEVLDKNAAKEIEKCRRVADLMELLGYQLSKGNRWVPDPAKGLLERELEARNRQGMARLKETLGQEAAAQRSLVSPEVSLGGSNGIKEYVARRSDAIRHDLNAMYRELRRGDSVPQDKFAQVLEAVEARLSAALGSRVTPRVNYNRLMPPDLTEAAQGQQWAQPLSLLLQSARLLRVALTDPYFALNFSKTSLTQQEFEDAMNVFGDTILKSRDSARAKRELGQLDAVEASEKTNKEKCHDIWKLIGG